MGASAKDALLQGFERGLLMYKIIDHTGQIAVQVRDDALSAQYAAFNFARDLMTIGHDQAHLSVVDSKGKHLLDIKATRRKEVREG